MHTPKYIRFKGATYKSADNNAVIHLQDMVTKLERGLRFTAIFPQLFLGLDMPDMRVYVQQVEVALAVLKLLIERQNAGLDADLEDNKRALKLYLEKALASAKYEEQRGPVAHVLRRLS